MSETTKASKSSGGLSDQERAAVKERARELKAESRRGANRAAGEKALLEKVAEMPSPEREMAEKLHTLIMSEAPALMPKTWYGMPAYAKEDKVICFFQSANKFNTRYSTLGFSDSAHLDDGTIWPTSYALTTLGPAEEAQIKALVRKAVS